MQTLNKTAITTAANQPGAVYVAMKEDDFIPFPKRTLRYRGLNLSRSSLYRLKWSGDIKVKKFRLTGGLQARTLILRESLDAWIQRQLDHDDDATTTTRNHATTH